MALVSDVVFSALILISAMFAASTVGFSVAWIRARERAIRAEQRGPSASGGDARFDQLEEALDAVAIEVERMSEGQRFVTRVLAERSAQERDAGAVRAAGAGASR